MADKVRIFADIDGTMAEWKEVSAYAELLERGYYRALRPNNSVVKALEILQEENGEEVELFSLSAYISENEHAVAEKTDWLNEYVSFIPEGNRLFCPCGSDKREVVPDGIRSTDILLDDYSLNLMSWAKTGRGLKLLNGVNATKGKWKGPTVSMFQSPEKIAGEIMSFVRGTLCVAQGHSAQ